MFVLETQWQEALEIPPPENLPVLPISLIWAVGPCGYSMLELHTWYIYTSKYTYIHICIEPVPGAGVVVANVYLVPDAWCCIPGIYAVRCSYLLPIDWQLRASSAICISIGSYISHVSGIIWIGSYVIHLLLVDWQLHCSVSIDSSPMPPKQSLTS